ncbi:hypothetical protein [Rhizobium sp. S163]|uniref:hypothetical protein n=1 Tax=Rhizobium sp. S163 TaxID=3055039 RepID=UPI0025AA0E18|nr:hypothetical protein [Rhizobium sp. S163]MDM9646761.1 hypothetical protein [Rhizobium sp. S163]
MATIARDGEGPDTAGFAAADRGQVLKPGKSAKSKSAAAASNVVNMMDALRKSVDAEIED